MFPSSLPFGPEMMGFIKPFLSCLPGGHIANPTLEDVKLRRFIIPRSQINAMSSILYQHVPGYADGNSSSC